MVNHIAKNVALRESRGTISLELEEELGNADQQNVNMGYFPGFAPNVEEQVNASTATRAAKNAGTQTNASTNDVDIIVSSAREEAYANIVVANPFVRNANDQPLFSAKRISKLTIFA